ncbi:MAG: hypothetical protein K6E78_06060 [Treponema sp.]|nr:hypothetical protein [Treponema sp.]
MAIENIIEREKEILLLQRSYESIESQFVILYGRRRVGKSLIGKIKPNGYSGAGMKGQPQGCSEAKAKE